MKIVRIIAVEEQFISIIFCSFEITINLSDALLKFSMLDKKSADNILNIPPENKFNIC